MYSVRAAAGGYGEPMEAEGEGWMEAPGTCGCSPTCSSRTSPAARCCPAFRPDSLCVFRGGEALAGSREKASWCWSRTTGETGENRYTIKRYESEKQPSEDSWEHKTSSLHPLNPEFEPWELTPGRSK